MDKPLSSFLGSPILDLPPDGMSPRSLEEEQMEAVQAAVKLLSLETELTVHQAGIDGFLWWVRVRAVERAASRVNEALTILNEIGERECREAEASSPFYEPPDTA